MAQAVQQIRFCTSRDGTRIAYTTEGSGPPLRRGPHWLSNLDLDRESPVWRPWLRVLSRHHTLIRYDLRGCGLSDRDGVIFTFEKFVEDFEAVADAVGDDRFATFGLAGGAMVAIAYAARHPDRVSHLVALGCPAQSLLVRAASIEQRQEAETQIKAIELGWSNDNPGYRQLFTSIALPDGTPEQFRSFNEQIRRNIAPRDAARIIETLWRTDLTTLAPCLRCPTLVLHSRGDARVPFEQGRRLAQLIPQARFVPLESRNHMVRESEPAWAQFIAALDDFIPEPAVDLPLLAFDELTAREREVLGLLAHGLDNRGIAARLKISEKTVRNHVSIIFGKLRVSSRAQAVAVARDAGVWDGSVSQRRRSNVR